MRQDPIPANLSETKPPRATAFAYSKGWPTRSKIVTPEIRALNLRDQKNNDALAKARQHIFGQLVKNQSAILDNVRKQKTWVFYDKTVFSNTELLRKTCFSGDKADSEDCALAWRHLTKHRTLASNTFVYGNGFGEVQPKPLKMGMVTHCAPNLMGSSPADESKFLEGAVLQLPEYSAIMKLGYKRMLHAALKLGGTVAISPVFGGGVYLNKLSKPEIAKAWQAGHQAFIDAYVEIENECKQSGLPFTIKEVIYCVPDKYDIRREPIWDAPFNLAITIFTKYSGSGIVTLTNADCLEVGQKAVALGEFPVLFNPGSDHTVGGVSANFESKFLLSIGHMPATLEKVYATLSDFQFRQAADYDHPVVLEAYPDSLQINNSNNYTITRLSGRDFVQISENSQTDASKRIIEIRFDDETNAKAFAVGLRSDYGIKDKSGILPRDKVIVKHAPLSNAFSVELTPDEYKTYLQNHMPAVLNKPNKVEALSSVSSSSSSTSSSSTAAGEKETPESLKWKSTIMSPANALSQHGVTKPKGNSSPKAEARNDRQEILDILRFYYVQFQKLEFYLPGRDIFATEWQNLGNESTNRVVDETQSRKSRILDINLDDTSWLFEMKMQLALRGTKVSGLGIYYSPRGARHTMVSFYEQPEGEEILIIDNIPDFHNFQPWDAHEQTLLELTKAVNQPRFLEVFAEALEKYTQDQAANAAADNEVELSLQGNHSNNTNKM